MRDSGKKFKVRELVLYHGLFSEKTEISLRSILVNATWLMKDRERGHFGRNGVDVKNS